MSKYKTGFVQEFDKLQEFEHRQKVLREKHDIPDANVVVVEKKHYALAAAKIIGGVLRVLCTVAIIGLAVIGAFSLIYPEPRNELWKIIIETLKQIRGITGV